MNIDKCADCKYHMTITGPERGFSSNTTHNYCCIVAGKEEEVRAGRPVCREFVKKEVNNERD